MKLLPVIAQDIRTRAVLMLAYADAEAIRRSRRTGFMHYWSRSRKRYWKKGESSGHSQQLVSLHYDCDRDTLLALVDQKGPACHLETSTCFGEKFGDFLGELEKIIFERKVRSKRGSYTARLLQDAALRRRKLVEEAAELAMASRGSRREAVVAEAADLVYHALVILASAGVSLEEVRGELRKRHASMAKSPSRRNSRQIQ